MFTPDEMKLMILETEMRSAQTLKAHIKEALLTAESNVRRRNSKEDLERELTEIIIREQKLLDEIFELQILLGVNYE